MEFLWGLRNVASEKNTKMNFSIHNFYKRLKGIFFLFTIHNKVGLLTVDVYCISVDGYKVSLHFELICKRIRKDHSKKMPCHLSSSLLFCGNRKNYEEGKDFYKRVHI